VTKSDEGYERGESAAADRRCAWCGRRLVVRPGPGRPRRYCAHACRQRDYEARQRAAEVGLSENELIVARQALADLHDRLYVLEAAIEDVERDLATSPTKRDYEEAVAWLLDAARPLLDTRLREHPEEPPAGS
jgi:hypothetical protein